MDRNGNMRSFIAANAIPTCIITSNVILLYSACINIRTVVLRVYSLRTMIDHTSYFEVSYKRAMMITLSYIVLSIAI